MGILDWLRRKKKNSEKPSETQAAEQVSIETKKKEAKLKVKEARVKRKRKKSGRKRKNQAA